MKASNSMFNKNGRKNHDGAKMWISRRASFPLRASNSNTINFTPRQNPIATPRLFRRELSSFKPLHGAIASAYLVSKLPSEASTSTQGRFANYISPI